MEKENKDPREKTISTAVINRLPRYYRYLADLKDAGVERISSSELAEMLGITASQIRQDFNCFGGFGQQGYGYSVPRLYENIASILGVNEGYRAVIVGTGNLGRALASSPVFRKRGVTLEALFDVSPSLVGQTFCGFSILGMEEFEDYVAEHRPDIAVLTVPRAVTREVAERIDRAGIRGVWNFTNIELHLAHATVQNIHLGDTLMTLCYDLREKSGKAGE